MKYIYKILLLFLLSSCREQNEYLLSDLFIKSNEYVNINFHIYNNDNKFYFAKIGSIEKVVWDSDSVAEILLLSPHFGKTDSSRFLSPKLPVDIDTLKGCIMQKYKNYTFFELNYSDFMLTLKAKDNQTKEQRWKHRENIYYEEWPMRPKGIPGEILPRTFSMYYVTRIYDKNGMWDLHVNHNIWDDAEDCKSCDEILSAQVIITGTYFSSFNDDIVLCSYRIVSDSYDDPPFTSHIPMNRQYDFEEIMTYIKKYPVVFQKSFIELDILFKDLKTARTLLREPSLHFPIPLPDGDTLQIHGLWP